MRTARTEARRHTAALVVVAVVVAGAMSLTTSWWRAPAYGWGAAAVVYNILVWTRIARMDAAATRDHAQSEEPTATWRALMVNLSTLISLATVGMLMADSANTHGTEALLTSVLALGTVAASWLIITTVFTLRYAALYYAHGEIGGINFNQDELPRYTDFAYMAFSLAMTYQISDTSITSTPVRTTALIHSIYAFIFGIAVTATSINLVISLGQ